jgi:hypothetical protein
MIILRNKNYSSVWEVAKSLFTKDKPIQVDNSVDIRLGEERRSKLKQNPVSYFNHSFGLIEGEQVLKSAGDVLNPGVIQEIKKYINLVRGFARTYCKWALDNPEAENLLNEIQDNESSRLMLINGLDVDLDEDCTQVLDLGFDNYIYYFPGDRTWGFETSTKSNYRTLKQILVDQKEYEISRIKETIKEGDEKLVPILDIFKQWLIQVKTRL